MCLRVVTPPLPRAVPASDYVTVHLEPVTWSPSLVPGTQSLRSQCLGRGDRRLQTPCPWRESDFWDRERSRGNCGPWAARPRRKISLAVGPEESVAKMCVSGPAAALTASTAQIKQYLKEKTITVKSEKKTKAVSPGCLPCPLPPPGVGIARWLSQARAWPGE